MTRAADVNECLCGKQDCPICGRAWLREKFWEYREGWLSERGFKLVLARYSRQLRKLREKR
jgi:hypothetical protein